MGRVIDSVSRSLNLVKHASFKGTIKATEAYLAVRHSDLWIPKAELTAPYPPDTPEKDGKVKTVRFTIEYNDKRIYITGWRFWETFLAAKEVFVEKEYDWLNVSGRKVLDLGAFTGDSAISFALRGASEVYTCEPNPNMIGIINYNLGNNKLQDKVKVLHCFVGEKSSDKTEIYFDDQNMVNRSSQDKLKLHKLPENIPTVTLDDLTAEYGINEGCLKMDIEGAEYGVVDAASLATLKKFSQIQIDFHKASNNSHESIKGRLEEAGFECKVYFVGTLGGGYIDAVNTHR